MMIQNKKDSMSLLALIGANLIPFAGIFFFGWDVTYIVLLYWWENLIAGFYNILKMTILKMSQAAENSQKLFLIPFFCIHYGGFCAVHGVFLTAFFNIGSGAAVLKNESTWWGPFIFVQLLFSVISNLWASKPPEMIWALAGLFISHGVSFMENYILGKEYVAKTLKELMHQPYQRIIVMHIAILIGGAFVMKLNSPLPLMIILVLLKISFDLHLHNRSHRQKQKHEPVDRDEYGSDEQKVSE